MSRGETAREKAFHRKVRDRLRFEPSRTVRDGIGELIEAFGQNRFADVDARPNFYGNYEINYPLSN